MSELLNGATRLGFLPSTFSPNLLLDYLGQRLDSPVHIAELS